MGKQPSTARRGCATTEILDPGPAGLARAAALLAQGRLVAFPTETVYGLGADARQPDAVARLYAAKGRPNFNPLIAHVADLAAARRVGRIEGEAEGLARACWPGPLTLVVEAAAAGGVGDLARAGLATVAIRVPAHPFARRLLGRTGFPVVAPSANRSGRVSPTEAGHVLADLDGLIDAVVDGGPAEVGVESTIVACLHGKTVLLRPGGLPRERIEALLGRALDVHVASPDGLPIAPGGLSSHYAPRAPMRLRVRRVEPREAVLLFGAGEPDGLDQASTILNLSRTGDLVEAAANLFGFMRLLDATDPGAIAVVPIPDVGLGEAINDRLARAAAAR